MIALLIVGGCSGPRFVDKVQVTNPTDYLVGVDVRGSSGGWLDLTTVKAGETREVRDVIDQGNAWTFRFEYGEHAAETRLDREVLSDSGWHVEVPAEFGETLRDQGVPPPS